MVINKRGSEKGLFYASTEFTVISHYGLEGKISANGF
jgi:hypothetical protein